MKKYTTYICETCGTESEDYDKIADCEADHLGLTVQEMLEYRALKQAAKQSCHIVSVNNNQENRDKYDVSVKELITFEKLHGIKSN